MRLIPGFFDPRVVALAALCGGVVAGCNILVGFGDPQLDPGGGGNASTSSVATTSTGGGGPGGGLPTTKGPCYPDDPVCNQAGDSICVALQDNSTSDKPALRVNQITVFKPNAFTSGLEATALEQAVMPNIDDCNLKGTGNMSMLVALDVGGATVRVGAAKPVVDPFAGYDFVTEEVQGLTIQPASVSATIATDGTINADPIDFLVLPIYLDSQANDVILMPIHRARLYDTKISDDHNCIGAHNSHGLEVANGCLPDSSKGIKAFIDGGKLDGYVLLEEADSVIIEAFGLNRSLCVVLSEDSSKFGDGGSPMRCKRLDGEVKFPGDWCSTTNAGGDGTCHDSVQFNMAFSAGAVRVNN